MIFLDRSIYHHRLVPLLTCVGSFGKNSVPNMVSPPKVTSKTGRPMEGRVIVKTFSFIKQMTSIIFLELFSSTSNLE